MVNWSVSFLPGTIIKNRYTNSNLFFGTADLKLLNQYERYLGIWYVVYFLYW